MSLLILDFCSYFCLFRLGLPRLGGFGVGFCSFDDLVFGVAPECLGWCKMEFC